MAEHTCWMAAMSEFILGGLVRGVDCQNGSVGGVGCRGLIERAVVDKAIATDK